MKKNLSLKTILIIIGVGIWTLVIQNTGIIPTSQKVRVVNTVDTYSLGGSIDADVDGSVKIENEVEVSGYLDVNLNAINGKENSFYRDRDGDYVLIPVLSR